MLTIPTLATGLVLALLLSTSRVHAQGTFDNLGTKMHPGQKVIVIDQQGVKTEGRVETISGTALVVNYGQGPATDPAMSTTRTFAPADVQRVLKPGHLWDGAIKGAIVGAIPALINIGMDCYDCMEGEFAALSISMGAGIGVGIDALFGPKTVFRGERRASRVSLAPILGTHGRRGV